MNWRLVAFLIIAGIAFAGAAKARLAPKPLPAKGAGRVDAGSPSSGPAVLQRNGVVWKSREDLRRGGDLIAAGAHENHPQLVMPLVACMADTGTAVTVIGRARGVREVVVDSGRHKGCTGWLPMEFVRAR